MNDKVDPNKLAVLKMRIPLPCGCTLDYATSAEPPIPHVGAFLEHGAEILSFWFTIRIEKEKRHRCELVSEENPNGIAPK